MRPPDSRSNDSTLMNSLPQSLRRSHTRSAAFTLVELLVIVGILVVVAGAVIVAFDDAGRVAGDDLTRQRMAAVREALLRFRSDMGYFPGQGAFQANDPLNPSAPSRILPSTQYDREYLDGQNPNTSAVSNAVMKAWADHPMNFWQLFQRPADPTDSLDPAVKHKWDWDPDAKRGWNGPYLNGGFHFRLDDPGTETKFAGGARLNRLMAVGDAFERNRDSGFGAYWRWINEAVAPPAKDYLFRFGQPLYLERQPSTGLPATFVLVSMGPDGEPDTADDLRLEVGREGI